MPKNNQRHLNVLLSEELAEEFDKLCPNRGVKSRIVRSLIRAYIAIQKNKRKEGKK